MAYTLSGKIKRILDLQTFPSGFTKRELVVTTDERFPQEIKLDCLKEKVDLLTGLSEGQEVTVHFDLRGREYNGRWFTDLTVWKIESGAKGAAATKESGAPLPEDTTDYGSSEDDIPF
jgi:single-strand DNA-binding protein